MKKTFLVVLLILMLLQQHLAYSQALPVAPAANFVINRAIGGTLTRVAIARGFAANDPRIAATLASAGTSLSAANVASTVVGIGFAVAGAPVWLGLAASLGVLAVGTALIIGNAKFEITAGTDGNRLKVTQASSSNQPPPYTQANLGFPPSRSLGAQVYRDPSCFASEPACYAFPALPTNYNFPYSWRPYRFDTGSYQKIWAVAFNFKDFKKYILEDLTGGNGTFDRSSQASDCYANPAPGAACTMTRAVRWDSEPAWDINAAGVARLIASWNMHYDVSPRNPQMTTYPQDFAVTNQAMDWVFVDASEKPLVGKYVSDILPSLSSSTLAQPVPDAVIAKIADAVWKQAAGQPNYAGLPYSVDKPVVESDVAAWRSVDPTPTTLGDLLVPPNQAGVADVPISPTVTVTVPNQNPNQNPNPSALQNVNVVNAPKVDLGTDPNIASPTLETTPTGSQILQPITSLFPELRGYQTPQHAGECPKPQFEVFGKSIMMDSHCTIVEQHRAMVIPPFLTGAKSRDYAVKANFCIGVMPPMAMLGRSLL